jgi:phosphoribosylformimino-5-aminoimidazole carboxamide ribotide isomerase
MIIFPAIDLKDGQCVRLYQGDMEQATIFNDSPALQAAQFEKEGFRWLHIVDLNGAFAGKPVNGDAVKSILESVSLPVQLGGGIRDLATIEYWLDAGVNRVILGTIALKTPGLVIEACKHFPDKIVVGIDAKDGKVAVHGWANVSEITVIDVAKRFEEAGVSAIIYTDINRDGTLTGPDIEGTKQLAQNISIDVIASGGISSLSDVQKIKTLEIDGVTGVVIGRALYDKKITPADVLKLEQYSA